MEYALWGYEQEFQQEVLSDVLILILMEYALWAIGRSALTAQLCES